MGRSRAIGQIVTLDVRSMRCRLLNHRSQSSSSSSSSDPLIRKLEDAIHRIIVRRSAPDWLPFLPGASYWVPPPPSQPSTALTQLLHNLANPNPNPITTPPPPPPSHQSVWPSSSYFIQGAVSQPHPLELDPNSHSQDEDDNVEE
ncbi:uncharacterized protein LOC133301573 [Gastrolobium bilobum]|uniref:uncharacterized protein LOC133301573 n=1 Tax=Gastrolobium bilobum TaxID=150636 RepID=UPI002AB2A333|nr:uncharacterized protein LOC133301573 [Gastrolobium bilobum]